ncbi:hypothetical protein B0H14DRAFT_2830333 [Mycena olivaceomarginata]|nr:hypothetical protein B0H14DRAFT_2830333 [Mycena olivaceomarginata]
MCWLLERVFCVILVLVVHLQRCVNVELEVINPGLSPEDAARKTVQVHQYPERPLLQLGFCRGNFDASLSSEVLFEAQSNANKRPPGASNTVWYWSCDQVKKQDE